MATIFIRNAKVHVDGTYTFIHAKLSEQTDMPKMSGQMVQHLPDSSYSYATLNYNLGNNVMLFLN